MRRWFIRWLKTQWTAVPLAFLIVTAFEFLRFEDATPGNDGQNCIRAVDNPAADAAGPPSAGVGKDLRLAGQPPSTKSPSKVDQRATGGKKPRKNVAVSNASSSVVVRPWIKYGENDIVVNASGPVVNPHPFNYLINAPDLCRGVDVFLINYVHTAVDHFTRRARIRDTWALQSYYRNFTIRTVFFVGLTTKAAWYQDALYYESKKYGDIVQKDFLDTYK